MHVTDIVQSVVIRNPTTGKTCSIYGSIPPGYTERVVRGWSVQLNDGTVGLGRPPFDTWQACADFANAVNDRRREQLTCAEHNPDSAVACMRELHEIPTFTDAVPC